MVTSVCRLITRKHCKRLSPHQEKWRCQRSQLKKHAGTWPPPYWHIYFRTLGTHHFCGTLAPETIEVNGVLEHPFFSREKTSSWLDTFKAIKSWCKNLTKLCGTTDLKHGHAWKNPKGRSLTSMFFSKTPKSEFKLCATMWCAWIVMSFSSGFAINTKSGWWKKSCTS